MPYVIKYVIDFCSCNIILDIIHVQRCSKYQGMRLCNGFLYQGVLTWWKTREVKNG